MAREQHPHMQLPQLPEDVLAHILVHVPLQQRLGSCSLASRSMREAAVAATDTIQLNTLRLQAKADALCAWLQRYGSQVLRRLEVDTPDFMNCRVKLPLPWQCLTQLQHLTLQGAAGLQLGLNSSTVSTSQAQQQQQQLAAAASLAGHGVLTRRGAAAAAKAAAAAAATAAAASRECSDITLAALTALTSLDIYCKLPIRCSTTQWITNQLRPLTNLRDFTLGSLGRVGSNILEYPPEDNAALGQVLGQLVQLTSLNLSTSVDGRVLSAASSLSQLRELRIDGLGSAEHPMRLQGLPCSLMFLDLDEGVLDCTIASSWQMPDLETLRVSEWEGAGFKPAVIARMPQLHWLELSVEVRSNPAWGITDVLAVLPQLQQLRRLKLYGMQYWPAVTAAADAALVAGTAAARAAAIAAEAEAAASCAALTASRQLSSLTLEDCWFPACAVQHMFPASKFLPFLQLLDINCCEGTLEDFDFQDEDRNPAEISRHGLPIQPGDLRNLVWCCPHLRELSMLWVESGIERPELQQLLLLPKLTKLGIGGYDLDDRAAVEVLAKMTGLQELTALAAREITVEGLACLTSLKHLRRLWVLGSKIRFKKTDSDSESDNDSTAPYAPKYEDVTLNTQFGTPPVAQQLEELCSSSFAALAVMYERAKEALEEQAQQLRVKDEKIRLQDTQLQAMRWRLHEKQLQLHEKEQQLQQREQQLAAAQQQLLDQDGHVTAIQQQFLQLSERWQERQQQQQRQQQHQQQG